jgi:hypothetical protein
MHAQAYQDADAATIVQVAPTSGGEAHACTRQAARLVRRADFEACIRSLLAERREGFQGHVELFRRKASSWWPCSTHLDDLDGPRPRPT